MTEQPTQAGFIAIVGRPNVGKSTLMNTILGARVAIVSNRAQTTRNRILGVVTKGPQQLVLLDTPGIHRRRADINRFMVREALDAVTDVDVVLVVTEVRVSRVDDSDATEVTLDDRDVYVLEQVRKHAKSNAAMICVINKIDRLSDPTSLLPLMARWQAAGFDDIVPVSATKNDGVERLVSQIGEKLPEGPHLFPDDMLTDRAERFLAAELIREQVFRRCREEIPHATAVEIEQFIERKDQGDVKISAVVFVERESQKGIVVGKQGTSIKEIGTAARQQIGRLLDCPVHLNLVVRVAKDWRRVASSRRRFGYE